MGSKEVAGEEHQEKNNKKSLEYLHEPFLKKLIVGLNLNYNHNRNKSAEQVLPTSSNKEGRLLVNAIAGNQLQ